MQTYTSEEMMTDPKTEKAFYIDVKFHKYGTYTIYARNRQHAIEQYEDGSWEDYYEEYDCYDEKVVDIKEEDATIQLSLEGVL